jgi:hypothetical protein
MGGAVVRVKVKIGAAPEVLRTNLAALFTPEWPKEIAN